MSFQRQTEFLYHFSHKHIFHNFYITYNFNRRKIISIYDYTWYKNTVLTLFVGLYDFMNEAHGNKLQTGD